MTSQILAGITNDDSTGAEAIRRLLWRDDPHDDDVDAGMPATVIALARSGAYGRNKNIATRCIPATVIGVVRSEIPPTGKILVVEVRCESPVSMLAGRTLKFYLRGPAGVGWEGEFKQGTTPGDLRSKLTCILGVRTDARAFIGELAFDDGMMARHRASVMRLLDGEAV